MKRILFFFGYLFVAVNVMAQELTQDEYRLLKIMDLDVHHYPSLGERLGDGPIFLFSTICAGFWIFFIGAIAYARFRQRYGPTDEQNARAGWLAATSPDVLSNAGSKKHGHWHHQALAALTPFDRDSVVNIFDYSGADRGPTTWKFFYKKQESRAWMVMFPVLLSPVLWAGYRLIWQGETATPLWWAYLVIFITFITVMGVLPITLEWNEISSRRRGDPVWQVNSCGIQNGSNIIAWPQIEEIRPHVVFRAKQTPRSLVLLHRWGEKKEKETQFVNIEPDNIRIFVHPEQACLSEAQTSSPAEIVLHGKELAGSAQLTALLRYRQHYARVAAASEWTSYCAALQ